MNRREAVDKVTKEYWAAYFGPYGKTWTKDVPRRVAAALVEALRTAAKVAGTEPLNLTRGVIAPLGWALTATGGLDFEGFFQGTTPAEAGRSGEVIRLGFKAEFDANGELAHLIRLAA